jgi:hypothetical protein
MQARYYDPLLARFMSNDPIGFRDIHSFNRYLYVNNNPYKYTDPTGMCGEGLCVGIALGLRTFWAWSRTSTVVSAPAATVVLMTPGDTSKPKIDPVEGILEDAKPTGKKGEYTKDPGNEDEQAQEDFDSITEGETKTYGNGTQVGETGDGRTVDLHGSSGKSSSSSGEAVSQGTPTIKVRNTNGKVKTTIRYVDKKKG